MKNLIVCLGLCIGLNHGGCAEASQVPTPGDCEDLLCFYQENCNPTASDALAVARAAVGLDDPRCNPTTTTSTSTSTTRDYHRECVDGCRSGCYARHCEHGHGNGDSDSGPDSDSDSDSDSYDNDHRITCEETCRSWCEGDCHR